ncbi:MAG: ABC transporter permease [Gemmatimonadaceae bacterium]|nr:ABC transporter permease [Gemmatimonadaceae bacterium]
MRVVAWFLVIVLPAATVLVIARSRELRSLHESPWAFALGRLARDRSALAGLWLICVLASFAILAPWLAPHAPTELLDIAVLNSLPPSSAFPFGTDPFSRDVFSRVIHGTRVSLGIALLAVTVSVTLGTTYGAIAGYYGGNLDGVMMRAIDAALSIPRVLLLLAILALWGHVSLTTLVLVLGLTGWFGVSRIVRAQVMVLRDEEWALAARGLGVRNTRILWRHILPNTLSPVIVAATLGIGNLIILEAGLSYLGMGVQQPTASWGNIMQDGSGSVAMFWWLSVFPGLMIVLTVMAFNIVGDGLRDALDPRQLPSQ